MRIIERAEDREMFKELCEETGRAGAALASSRIPSKRRSPPRRRSAIPSCSVPRSPWAAPAAALRTTKRSCARSCKTRLKLSPVHQVLVEKSIKGYKEIEYEVMRDANDTAITICNMENIDPVGIHTGDSIVVAPSQTLTNTEYQHAARQRAASIIRALKIEGGCNVQFALDPQSFHYYVIEVNPRVSRSSALASKASGYPIARVSAQDRRRHASGRNHDSPTLRLRFEPALDYVVTKMPRFPFDKFATASNKLSTQMKATGEVMSIGRTLEESLLKAVRSLEIGDLPSVHAEVRRRRTRAALMDYIHEGTDDRLLRHRRS